MPSLQWHESQELARQRPLVRVLSRVEHKDGYGCVLRVTEVMSCGHTNDYAPRVARASRRCDKCWWDKHRVPVEGS